jgi:cytochrome P450
MTSDLIIVIRMIGQIVSFIIAGHETTSTSLTWCLYSLSQHPEMQSKLREEILSSNEDDFASLPYLDAVVRETMRRLPAVQGTIRAASEAEIIPLDEPVKLGPRAGLPWSLFGLGGKVEGSYRNEQGDEMVDSIKVEKGQNVFFSIEAFNRSKKIWGEDVEEFRPERWIGRKDGEGKNFGGGWGDMMTL